MTKWHLRSKKKETGGQAKRMRKKKKFERGSAFLETKIGKNKAKFERVRGGNKKIRLLSAEKANIFDPKTKKSMCAKIVSVKENTANPHYVRRNIITRGAVIDTELGLAKVTSRPGQDGIINAVLIKK